MYEKFMLKIETELRYFTNMIVYYGKLACWITFKDMLIHKLSFSLWMNIT